MERRANQINRQNNRNLAHGVRIDGTVYLHGVPRTLDTERQKKNKHIVTLVQGKTVALKFGK